MSFLSAMRAPKKTALTATAAALGFSSVCGIAVATMFLGYGQAYAQRIYPGVSVWDVPLDGLTVDQARQTLEDRVQKSLSLGWHFRFDQQEIVIHPLEEHTPLVSYDVDQAVTRAYAAGRGASPLANLTDEIRLRVLRRSLDVPVTIDQAALEAALRDHLKGWLTAAKDAELYVSVPTAEAAPTVTVVPEKTGRLMDFGPATGAIAAQAKTLDFQPIALNEMQVVPERTAQDIQRLTPAIPDLLSHAPFTVTAFDHSWTITKSALASWLNVVTSTDALDLDPDRVQSNLQDLLKNLLTEPKDGLLTMENGKMKEFVAPQTGVVLDPAGTIQAIKDGWAHGSSTIPLVLLQITPQLQGPDAEALGVREILGVGRSDFSRSPANRIKNIEHGAALVNGTLIAPDEEFSLLKTLGSVDASHGWLEELVIKGDKTEPDYGGGLCQIGTTSFRVALASGVPITERQNHSYRVRYYEPAGTDATIYSPAPDFRFKNDTGHWILITTHTQGTELTFTFWGTKDGRTVVQTTPKIFNIVPPPEKKIVETLDLPPGKTKCTEVAHAGADTTFDYIVTAADGTAKKVTFRSHYKPWGAVCLLGVAQLSNASGTASGIDETGINNPN